jgi:glycogen phosphorylase
VTAQPRYALPIVPEGLRGLIELSLDLRWSWSHSADELWQILEPDLWEITHNPWHMLQTISQTRLEELAADKAFLELLNHHLLNRRETLDAPSWFSEECTEACRPGQIAYFSMEFGLGEALPIYSGGLGILAGDFLKVASDLGIPIVGVGLLWQQGYFRQALDSSGNQIEFYPFNDPGQLPIVPLRDSSGEWVNITLRFPRRQVKVRVWEVSAGRVKLYLLDTNDLTNNPADRGITGDLYGGGPEVRLQQEIVLGIGGWRLLRELGIEPDVCHLNEGHAAFAVLERARCFMEDEGVTFPVALTATRAGNLFTTHTPVEAGFDRFNPKLVREFLGEYAGELGISEDDLLTLGRLPEAPWSEQTRALASADEPFNMAYMAIRGSGAVNGVSKLHGEVSRGLFQSLFPRWPHREVPVGHVTNGIHVPSWDSPEADALWTKICGKGRWLDGVSGHDEKMRAVGDEELWAFRDAGRRKLIAMAREHVQRQGPIAGSLEEMGLDVNCLCDPGILTLGFARRFTSYKRVNLLLHDPERLERLLCGEASRVQLVLAGKAHPADTAGKAMIRQWTEFIRRCEVRPHVLFLVDYDMAIAEHLVHGVDVWINTPRRPWEASGTSGMKVLVNGGLNLSELDGWWAEAYSPEVGWAIGDGLEHADDPAWDAIEAERLYDLIENHIIPEFYDRDEKGIPRRWIGRVRESMARLTPEFSANRMQEQYLREYYFPAATEYRRRAAAGTPTGPGAEGTPAAEAAAINEWAALLRDHWHEISLKNFKVEQVKKGAKTAPSSATYSFSLDADLGAIPADAVRVELYAEPLEGAPANQQEAFGAKPVSPEIHALEFGPAGSDCPSPTACTYSAKVSTSRPPGDFTPRIIPAHPGASVPLEAAQILWYR